MAEVIKKDTDYGLEGLPSIESVPGEPKKESFYDHPIFAEPNKAVVKEKWKAGGYTTEEVQLYIAGTNVKKKGFFQLEARDVKALYKGGHLLDGMAEEYIAFRKHGKLPSSWSGEYLLSQMAQGRKREDVMKDFGGIEFTFADPMQLVVDALTGGSMIGLRMGAKATVKAGAKTGVSKKVVQWTKDFLKSAISKEGAKEAGIQTGFGIAAVGGMIGAEKAGGGTGSQLLAGLVTPMGASVLLNMTRQSFIQLFRRMQKGSPSLAREVRNIIVQSDELDMKHLREVIDEFDEATLGATRYSQYDEGLAIPSKKKDAPTASQDAAKVAAKAKEPEIEIPPMTRAEAEELLVAVRSGKSDGEILKQLGKGRGAEMAAHIHKIHNAKIEKARGGVKPRKDDEAKALKFIKDNYTSFADKTGRRVLDVENALGDVQHLQGNMKNVSEKLATFQDVYATMLKEIEPLAKRTDLTFVEEIALANKIQQMAAFTEAIYGIRAEFGRGLGMFNRQFRKMPMDLSDLPRQEFEMVENATRSQVQKYLKRWRKAEGLKEKLNVARTANQHRFWKGGLELMQGSLLWHFRTQGINIIGNLQAWGTETVGRYAGVSYDAWKIAGGLKKPISFNKERMGEVYYDMLSHRTAFIALFRSPTKVFKHVKGTKGAKAVAAKPEEGAEAIAAVTRYDDFAHKVQSDEEIGSFWKALVTGEAQIDPFYKIEGQEGKAIEEMMSVRWKGKTLLTANPAFKQTIGGFFRLSFKGLTAMDEVFKTIGINQKLSSEMFRKGMTDQAEDMDVYIKTGLKNIKETDPIMLKSKDQGRLQTFTKPLGETAAAFERLLNTGRFGLGTKLTTLPFFKILVNLTKYSLVNSPFGLLSKDVQQIILKGTSADRAEVVAKMMVGATAMLGGVLLYESGKISGRTPRTQFQGWDNAHAQDYSWVHRDEKGEVTGYTDYSLLDPAASWIMVAADLALATHMLADAYTDDKTMDEHEEAIKDAMVAYGLAFVEPFVNRTFAKGVNETLTLVTNPERTDMGNFTMKQMNKFYPRLIDMVNDASGNNKIRREAHSVSDGFWKRFDPSKLEPMRHAVYGTIEMNDPRTFGVLNYKRAVDPIQTEMMKLGMNIRPLEDAMRLVGEKKKLTPEQYGKLGKELEKLPVKQWLQEVMDDSGYKETDDATKAMLLNRVITSSREIAVAKFRNTEEGKGIDIKLIEQLKITEASIRGIKKKPSKYGRFYEFLTEEERK